MDGWMEVFSSVKEPLQGARQNVGGEAQIKARLPHDGEGANRRWEKKKEAKLAARGGRRRWSGLRDTEEVGERDEKSRCRVDLEMNNEAWTRYPAYRPQYQQVHPAPHIKWQIEPWKMGRGLFLGS